jgi:NAD(P)-dependent dehydrogenase (short-subunit alcohol dehydrogenase family)
MRPTEDLIGKVALLTGALGTLGRAQAAALAEAGACVLLLDRPDHAEGLDFSRELSQKADAKVLFVGQDLNDLSATEAIGRELASAHGGIDILINNAALIVNRPFEEFSLEEYEEQIRVNSSAAFALARAVAPGMKAKRYGKIVNFCSVTLNGRWDGYAPYVASKGALFGLTKSLARELGLHGVRVNAVSPGAVISDAEERVFGDRLPQYNQWVLENQCLKSRIEPRHIADLVLFLVSPAADMISGQNISVDGGW